MIKNSEFNQYCIYYKSELITKTTNFYSWSLLNSLIGKNVYWFVNNSNDNARLPMGYSGYVVKNEGPNLQWLYDQAEQLESPIFVLNVCNNTYFDINKFPYKNIHWLPWIEWHYQIKAMLNDFPALVKKNLSTKISCLVHMSKTNKLVALASVLRYHKHDCLVSHHCKSYYGNTDIDTEPTGHDAFDNLLKEIQIYCTEKKVLDDLSVYNNNFVDLQKKIHNFHHDAYQTCAINVTNESFFRTNNLYTPGPFLTEKTFNCILGETAFLANGQYGTYKVLENMGFEFDYGLNLTHDNLIGDLDRMVSLHNLINSLQYIDIYDIFSRTRDSCQANKEHIMSGKFYNICENINIDTVEKIHYLL